MPQGPLQANVAINTTNKSAPLQLDTSGNLLVGKGSAAKYNVLTPTVIKAIAGRLAKLAIQVAPTSGTVTANDAATTGTAAIGNQFFSITAAQASATTLYDLDWPCATGIVVNPGTSGVVSVSYD